MALRRFRRQAPRRTPSGHALPEHFEHSFVGFPYKVSLLLGCAAFDRAAADDRSPEEPFAIRLALLDPLVPGDDLFGDLYGEQVVSLCPIVGVEWDIGEPHTLNVGESPVVPMAIFEPLI